MTPRTRREALQQEAELRAYKEVKADVEYLASEYDRLMEQYPDQWVAIHAGEVVATAGGLDELMRSIEAKGLVGRSPIFEFMNTGLQVLSLN